MKKKEVTKKFKGTDQGFNIEQTLYAKGDEVQRQTVKSTAKFSDLGIKTPQQKEEIKGMFAKEFEKVKKLKGVKVEEKYTDTEIIINTEIDYTKAELKQLKDNKLIEGEVNSDKVSLEKASAEIEKSGLKEVK